MMAIAHCIKGALCAGISFDMSLRDGGLRSTLEQAQKRTDAMKRERERKRLERADRNLRDSCMKMQIKFNEEWASRMVET